MEPELINSLPAEQFLRNQQYRDFTIGLGMLHGEDSSMFYLNPDGTRYSFSLRPVYHAHDYYELIYVMDGVLTHANTDDILYASILHYLQEQHGRVSCTELAEVLHYHPDYLNRVVKRHSGLSFKQMGQEYRKQQQKQTPSR